MLQIIIDPSPCTCWLCKVLTKELRAQLKRQIDELTKESYNKDVVLRDGDGRPIPQLSGDLTLVQFTPKPEEKS